VAFLRPKKAGPDQRVPGLIRGRMSSSLEARFRLKDQNAMRGEQIICSGMTVFGKFLRNALM
jgi:hypothetical protein